MKKLLIAILTLSAFSSFAAIDCNVQNSNVIDYVEFLEGYNNNNQIRVHFPSENIATYYTNRTFKNIKNNDSDTFIAREYGSTDGDKSILIRIHKGATSGVIAIDSYVLNLSCQKQ